MHPGNMSVSALIRKICMWVSDVRVAERSKAPDLRIICTGFKASGPHMWAWVQIPPLTSDTHIQIFRINADTDMLPGCID